MKYPLKTTIFCMTILLILLSVSCQKPTPILEPTAEIPEATPTSPTTQQITVESYALKGEPDPETLVFTPVDGLMRDVLAKHESEREKPAQFSLIPITVDSFTYNASESYTENKVSVIVTRNDEVIYNLDAGVISPISNYRGFWLDKQDWYLEVAHVEEDPVDPNAAFNIWGEIIKNGTSVNQLFNYSEAFDFQVMAGKPFYFFIKDGLLGISFDGIEHQLEFTDVPHYLCCSAGGLNPRSFENMVAFFAKKDGTDYYIEIGVFE